MNYKYSRNISLPMKLLKMLSTILFVVTLFVGYSAKAANVVYEDVGFISGTEANTSQFFISQAGIYEAKLIDFVFPATFDVLSFQLTTGSPSQLFEVDRLENSGRFTFEASAGNYYANLLGMAGGDHHIGLYGLQITQLSSVVPLPPAVLLFLSSALVMLLFGLNGNPVEKEEAIQLTTAEA